MTRFVIVYDRLTGRTDIQEFTGEDAREDALAARFAAERTASADEEVALLSAASRDDLKVTHSRYFSTTVRDAIDDLAAAGH